MLKLAKYIFPSLFLTAFLVSSYLHYLWVTNEEGFPLSPFVYLFFLLTLISSVIFLKVKSSHLLWFGLFLFLIASFFATFGLLNMSEPLFRFDLILWLLGMVWSLTGLEKR